MLAAYCIFICFGGLLVAINQIHDVHNCSATLEISFAAMMAMLIQGDTHPHLVNHNASAINL